MYLWLECAFMFVPLVLEVNWIPLHHSFGSRQEVQLLTGYPLVFLKWVEYGYELAAKHTVLLGLEVENVMQTHCRYVWFSIFDDFHHFPPLDVSQSLAPLRKGRVGL